MSMSNVEKLIVSTLNEIKENQARQDALLNIILDMLSMDEKEKVTPPTPKEDKKEHFIGLTVNEFIVKSYNDTMNAGLDHTERLAHFTKLIDPLYSVNPYKSEAIVGPVYDGVFRFCSDANLSDEETEAYMKKFRPFKYK